MKSSDAYKIALSRVKESPAAIDALGTPIKDGFFVNGGVEISGDTGHAQFTIPISGPKGSATIQVIATKAGGQWHFARLQLITDKDDKLIPIPEHQTPPAL